MLTKEQLINGILQINRTANWEWLKHFDISELQEYLDRLYMTQEPRGPHSYWIRPGFSQSDHLAA